MKLDKKMDATRRNMLIFAEAMDAWRVIPRMMLMAYGYLVFNLYIWYKNIPTYVQEKCDATVLTALTKTGMTPEAAKAYACTVVDVVGGPTAAQSTFVTTIIGLSTGIFGLYTATGRKWESWEPKERNVTEVTNYAPDSPKVKPTGPASNGGPKAPDIDEEEEEEELPPNSPKP